MASKKHRLDKEFYTSNPVISFTLCLEVRKDYLNNDNIFTHLEKMLLVSLEKHNMLAIVYLFMPDHVHLVTRSTDNTINPLKAVNLFKQKSGYWFSKDQPHIAWQASYYDHIIRNDKDLFNQIIYILNNPVRGRLTENWKDYKYKGSQVYDFNDLEF